MKAIKLYKIKWNLEDVPKEEMDEVKKSLPEVKGFMAPDDFDVVDKVPGLMKKHYGYEINTFSYSEIIVLDTLDELLKMFTEKGEKPKKLFKSNGELSAFGEGCMFQLKNAITRRFTLQFKGIPESEMPKILDTVMLSIEKIYDIEWDEQTEDDVVAYIDNDIEKRVVTPSKKKKSKSKIWDDEDFEDEDIEEKIPEDEDIEEND